jgi:PadR family transcriptional regulator PadR
MPGRRRGESGCPGPRRRRGMRLVLRPALLVLLAEGDSHGYELIDQLDQLGFDAGSLDSSIIYRDLRDMEEMGLIQSTWDDESKGPKRRVYQIKEEGLDRLRGWLESLGHVQEQIDVLQKRYKNLSNQEE